MERFDEIKEKRELLAKIEGAYRDILYESSQFLEDASRKNLENRLNEIETFENEFVRQYENFTSGDVSQLIIGVIGTVKSGKSTFINSLIGDDLLKMDFTPSTARISRIQYGDEFEIYSKFKSGRKEKTTPEEFKEICNHGDRITDKDDDLDYFIIYYPAEVLKKFVFIDTPGFSSLYASDDILTKSWIPKLDLIIWLVSPFTGGWDAEQNIIFEEFKEKDKVAVLNMFEQKKLDDINRVKENLQNKFDHVYPYPAKQILENQLSGGNLSNEFERLIKQAKDDFSSKTDFILSLEQRSLSYYSNSLEKSIIRILPSIEPRIKSYHSEFTSYLNLIRDRVVEIRSKEMESKLSRSILKEKEHLSVVIKRLQSNLTDFNIYQAKLDNDQLESSENLISYLKKKYKQYRSNLFPEIFDAIFKEIVVQESNLLRSEIRAFGLKDSPENGLFDTVVKLVQKSFRNFSSEVFLEIERNIGVKLSEHPQIAIEQRLVETMENKLGASVGDSIKVLVSRYKPENDRDLSGQRKRLEEDIDLIIPDEQHSELLESSIKRITYLIFDQNSVANQQKINHINTAILMLEGVQNEITY